MSHNFITNNTGQKVLRDRVNTLISISDELKFLVGFFYFSGWKEVYEQLKANSNITLKLLVGLEVDKMLNKGIVEFGFNEKEVSDDDRFNNFMSSLQNALDNDDMDNKEFYNQVSFFLDMIREERLIIRKTKNPNHSKLYIFRLNDDQAILQGNLGQFITGSSNLTSAGLVGQEEFNVEIRDYGYKDADQFFNELWSDAAPITEDEAKRIKVLDYVGNKTLAAKVTPFEAYVLVLKSYLDLIQQKVIKSNVLELLEKNGFKEYSYQVDAVDQALNIIDEYKGVIIADVVGLGKSVIASMIAKNLNKRTLIICPPALIGDKNQNEPSGWYEYKYGFELDAEIESRGKLEDVANSIDKRNIEVVIVDEAHYFRNQDTDDYDALQKICNNRIVILLTATPFNNSPADIFSLLKLFIIPGKSGITINNDLEALFTGFGSKFNKLSYILKYGEPKPNKKGVIDPKKIIKKEKAETYYKDIFKELPIDTKKVKHETKILANRIKNIISPVTIRRNRIDLKNDYLYSKEVTELSDVKDPKELYYELTKEQSAFYDKVITEYFSEEGRFTGAIYQPYTYEKEIDYDKLDEQSNRLVNQQNNLYSFMRRLLVKRFESSFGAFSESVNRFIGINKKVLEFIEKTKGRYILDRKLIKVLLEEEDIEKIDEVLKEYEQEALTKDSPKNNKIYFVDKFYRKKDFFKDIHSDIQLFKEIQKDLIDLDIIENDPKRDRICEEIDKILKEEPNRKVLVFSEYVDTVNHLEPYFKSKYKDKILISAGDINNTKHHDINVNFNAQFKGEKQNQYDILLTSDKLSEGFNLNRAGVIINYDIPWNPTRVIQRVGRINRIGTKVFDELFIYNFFPTEKAKDIVQIKEIATQKMYLIHNALGEDAKIFDEDEEPTASKLFNKLNENPENGGEESLSTRIRNEYYSIETNYPEVIEKINNLPIRIKSGKKYSENQVCVLRKKGLGLFTHYISLDDEKQQVNEITFEEFLDIIKCDYKTPFIEISDRFWDAYDKIRNNKSTEDKKNIKANSLESKTISNLKCTLKIISANDEELFEFIKVLLDDIKNYKTLSERRIGILGRVEITNKTSKEQLKDYIDTLKKLRNYLGADYLEKIKKRVDKQKNEIVIAIENSK